MTEVIRILHGRQAPDDRYKKENRMTKEYLPIKEGKVREIYDNGDSLIMVATDRISCFDVILNNTVTKKDNCKTIIIYRDVITDKLYIKEEDIFSNRYSNEKCILNNLCKEISVRELENTYNKKFIIADVYTYNKCKEYNILVCNADDKLFISNNILLNFNIYLDDARKIIINKEIYTQVNDNIIDYLNSLNSESIKINIVNKKIIPVNKEQ